MEINFATTDDIKGILDLQTQIYRVEALPQNANKILADLLNRDFCDVLVAKDNNKAVGSIFVFYLPTPAHGKPYAFLEGLVVDKNYQGRGIGTALINKIIEMARAKNCYKIIFTSGIIRRQFHKFYEKLGFKKWGYEFRMNLE